MVSGLIDTGEFRFTPHLADVEALNEAAFSSSFQVTKLSFHAYLLLEERYGLLRSGAALGHGCGPLLVARDGSVDLENAVVAIPGRYTTAWMLLRLWMPRIAVPVVDRFDRIMAGVSDGKYDAGLIIHEGRFVYPRYGLIRIVDLGEWWETETAMPIPLGCIALDRKSRFYGDRERIADVIRRSVEYARAHPEESRPYVKSHALEMDDGVIDEHIGLYVNRYTIDLGSAGMEAVDTLREKARCAGIIP